MLTALENVTKSFDNKPALDDFSLTIGPGQVVAILGRNGAGKTTLLRLLTGLLVPDRGRVLYDGETFHRDRLDIRRRFFFLPDAPPFVGDMTPIQHTSMVLRLYQRDKAEGIIDRVVELMREFAILELAEKPVSELSRGQQYKTALVALLAADPELWIFDEPLASGVDAEGIAALKRHCFSAAKAGKTILYSTQIVEVVQRFSDRVIAIDRGKLLGFNSLNLLLETISPSDPLHSLFRSTEDPLQ